MLGVLRRFARYGEDAQPSETVIAQNRIAVFVSFVFIRFSLFAWHVSRRGNPARLDPIADPRVRFHSSASFRSLFPVIVCFCK
jgi:hypothetical protein